MADVNSIGFAALNDKIAMFRVKLSDVAEGAAPAVSAALLEEQRKTIAAQTDAYGGAWTPKKIDDGDFRFAKPADVVAGAIGNTIIVRIKERVVVLHHNGHARGNVARRVIPYGGKIPPRWSARIKAIVLEHMRKAATE